MRAFLDGAAPSLLAHLQGCRPCTTEWSKLGELRALAQKLPAAIPDATHRDAMRAALLAKLTPAPPQPARRRVPARWLWASGAAVAACLLLLLRSWPGDRTRSALANFRATVQTQGSAARFVHERNGGDEQVRLSSGHLLIEVAPLHPGERFRVLCQDAEVEVRGTAFELAVADDHLREVRVLHGRVEVRPSGGRTLLLGAGERWPAGPPGGGTAASPAALATLAAPATSADSVAPAALAAPAAPAEILEQRTAGTTSVSPAGYSAASGAARRANTIVNATLDRTPPTPAATRAPHPPAPPRPPPKLPAPPPERLTVARPPEMSAAEQAFDEGWSALQRSEFGPAAAAFARIESAAGNESIVEDARFWRAVALGRSGQSQDAAYALRRFLSLHPGSSRAGEAAAILGWLLVKQGQFDEAKVRFHAAALDSRDEVRQSARAGLANLAARRPATSDLRAP